MKFFKTQIDGALRVDIQPHSDERGFFARTYCIDEFRHAGVVKPLVQNSISHNIKAGTLRGMHYHAREFPQTRLLRCVAGSLYVVILDLRRKSQSFLKHETFEISSDDQTAIFVPHGLALGYQTLDDRTTVYYQMSELYDPQHERGVRWNDPAFGIEWPESQRTIIERDANYPDFSVSQAL